MVASCLLTALTALNVKFPLSGPVNIHINLPPKCGMHKHSTIPQGATSFGDAKLGEYPWTVKMVIGHDLYLTGALIHPKLVLTTALDTYGRQPNEFKVSAGLWREGFESAEYPVQVRGVAKIIRHHMFRRANPFQHNIAMLVLDKPVVMTKHINTICLPTQARAMKGCLESTWVRLDNGTWPATMVKKHLESMSREDCLNKLWQIHDNSWTEVHTFCARFSGSFSICRTLPGSPLSCPAGDHEELVGILDWYPAEKNQCMKNLSQFPRIYVQIIKYTNWINAQKKQAGLDKPTINLIRK